MKDHAVPSAASIGQHARVADGGLGPQPGNDSPGHWLTQSKGTLAGMTQFLGTHENRRDGKGRVSIPASFRAALRGPDGTARLILRPSHKYDCIEGWPAAAFHAMAAPLDEMPTFDDDEENLALSLYAEATEHEPDKEGRIVLPADLAAHAALVEAVAFIGVGKHFQIWEPEAGRRRIAEARAAARDRHLTLRAARPAKPEPSA
jgi:MraZ protein